MCSFGSSDRIRAEISFPHDSFITNRENYDRNHGPLAHLSASNHTIAVEGLIPKALTLTIANLMHDYPQHSVTCALQCAGNRRHSMRTRIKEVQGIDWEDGAIMNCTWEGPRLRDILLRAGVEYDKNANKAKASKVERHVQFASHSQECQEDKWYGGSIPLDRALAAGMDVVLALKVRLPVIRRGWLWGRRAA